MYSPWKVDFWRWKHFTPAEVLSATGVKQYMGGNLLVQPAALDFLEEFRASLGRPLRITSGYRTVTENRDCGGSLLSRHCQGIAFDLSCDDIEVGRLFDLACAFGWGAVGLYEMRGFIHVDCRAVLNGKPTTWKQ